MIQQKQKSVNESFRKKNPEYIVYVGWRNFDDERVSPLANVKDLVRSDAYVLFYRHRNLPVNFVIKDQLERILSNHQLCENNSDTINC
jgi:hypothetical protein